MSATDDILMMGPSSPAAISSLGRVSSYGASPRRSAASSYRPGSLSLVGTNMAARRSYGAFASAPIRSLPQAQAQAASADPSQALAVVRHGHAGSRYSAASSYEAQWAARREARARDAEGEASSRVRGRQAERRVRERESAQLGASGIERLGSWALSHRLLVGFVALLFAATVLFYTPLKACYGASRTSAALASKLSAVTTSNDELKGEVDALMTRDGIEDEARRRGYVMEGETPVDMSGLEDTSATSDASGQATDEAWYVPMLDFVFGYDASTQGLG